MDNSSTITYNQSFGTVTVVTFGSTGASFAGFDIGATGSSFTMSGGSIVLQKVTSFTSDYLNLAATNSVTGGTIQIGNASTLASSTFRVNSSAPVFNFTVSATNLPAVQLVTNNLTIGGTLTMSGGNIDGATNNLTTIVTNSATGAVSRTAGYVNHKLIRAVATTGANYLWPVGFSTNYTPATYNFTNLTSGNLQVLAVTGDEPNIASSAINGANSVNMYWTTTATASAASTNYAGNYAWPSALNDGTVAAGSFINGKYNAGWTYTTINGTPTSTTLAFTGANNFGNHAIGNCRTATTANADADQTVCGTTATLAGNTATVGAGLWTLISGAGTITTSSSPTSGVTGLGVGANVFGWTISNAPCNATSDAITITRSDNPTAANAGADQTVCATTATLAGNTATVGTGAWTLVSGAGSITTSSSPTSGITGLGGGANVFRWTISNAPCTATSDDVSINTPSNAAAGPDQTVCAATATLAGNTPTVGTGSWTLVSGAGTITTSSSPTSGVTGLGVGANVFGWTISNAPCNATSDAITITRTAVLGSSLTIGAGTSSDLIIPAYGLYNYSWYAGIWLQSEVGAAKQITGIEFEVSSYTTPYAYNNLEIWLHQVTNSIFPSTTPQINLSDMTISKSVKVATVNLSIATNGWQTINFSTNYCYDGINNLIVEYRNYDGTWISGYGSGKYDFTPSISRAAYQYSDSSFPTGTGDRSNSRINTKFKY